MSNKVYEIVTDRIIAELEKGTIPWRQPWKYAGLPANFVSKRRYRGINILLLSSAGHSTRYWLTQKQVENLGGYVRPGEKATLIVFWKWLQIAKRNAEAGKQKQVQFPMIRRYDVFNTDQVEGIGHRIPPEQPRSFKPIQRAEETISRMPNRPEILHGDERAYYTPWLDRVVLPPKTRFDSEDDYYSVAFHELTHSTGHPSRVKRFEANSMIPFGSLDYSKEELVAEFGASFLCAEAGIDASVITNSAAYIQGWLSVLRKDKRMVLLAATQAQRAADFILNRKV